MRYVFEQRVSHASVDFLGEQKLSALLGLLEQAAVEASQACGWGPEVYAAARGVWIIRRTRVCRSVAVGGLDQLRVETSVADVRRARSLREYVVWRGQTKVAEGASDWVYCDVERRRPARVPAELAAALYGGSPVPSLERSAHPLEIPQSSGYRTHFLVRPSHLDHMEHVNNAAYADFLEDAALDWCGQQGWPLEKMLAHGGALRPVAIDVEYLEDIGLGETLEVETWGRLEDVEGPPSAGVFTQFVRRTGGAVAIRALSIYSWRTRASVLGRAPR